METKRIHLDYEPLPKQAAFHLSPARFRFYIGGFGSGKTLCGAMEALKVAMQYPGGFGLIARKTYPELRDTTRRTCLEEWPREVVTQFKESENHLWFANGSEVIFRHLENTEHLLSLNLDWFWIDEGSEVTEDEFLKLVGRLRGAKGPRRGWVTGNPEGHNWFWARCVRDAAKHPDHHLVVAPTTENVHLPPDYVQTLLSTYEGAMLQRYVMGDFSAFEGQIYDNFSRAVHVVRPFAIPDDWPRVVAADHGYTNPAAFLWLAVDPDGDVVVYDEHYAKGMLVSEHAAVVKAKGLHGPVVMDPSTRATQAITGKSVADEYLEHDVATVPAVNDVRAGINRVKEYLKVRDNGRPRLYIAETCVNLISEMESYKWRDIRPGQAANAPEEPVKQNDHAVDALRYGVMYLPALGIEPWSRDDIRWPLPGWHPLATPDHTHDKRDGEWREWP